MYGDRIFLITEVDANKISDYAVTKNAVLYLIQGENKQPVSMVPNKPEATGLVHFFKKGGNWVFVTEDEYEAKKNELPQLCFATRYPIANFSEKNFPDLEALGSQVSCAADGAP